MTTKLTPSVLVRFLLGSALNLLGSYWFLRTPALPFGDWKYLLAYLGCAVMAVVGLCLLIDALLDYLFPLPPVEKEKTIFRFGLDPAPPKD